MSIPADGEIERKRAKMCAHANFTGVAVQGVPGIAAGLVSE